MRPRTVIASAVLLPGLCALLVGCQDLGPTSDDLLEQIAVHRDVWESKRPPAYRYELARSCNCNEEGRGPVWVRVQGAQVVSQVYSSTGDPVSTGLQGVFPSVDGLFDLLEEAARSDVWSINVAWHPDEGYPVTLFVDYDGNAINDEIGYTVVTAPAADAGS